MRTHSILGAMMALALLGCGGGGGDDRVSVVGDVTGAVVDANGAPVRGARIESSAGGRETLTDSSGAYILVGVTRRTSNPDGGVDVPVLASISLDTNDGTVNYFGQNVAVVYPGESTPNNNITLYEESRLTSIFGQVRDNSDNVVIGARVFAKATDGTMASSATVRTDRNGNYELKELAKGVTYQLVVSAVGFGEGRVTKTVPNVNNPSDADRRQNLTLGDPTTGTLVAPQDFQATAYTTPGESTTNRAVGADPKAAYEAIKRRLDPQRTKRSTTKLGRDASGGGPISVDLTWLPYDSQAIKPNGFLIDRADLADEYYFHDPLAELFSDSDVRLVDNTNYTYSVRAITSSYVAGGNTGVSASTPNLVVNPLDNLDLLTPSNATVRWNAVSGAASYAVYVYEFYPDIDLDPILTRTTSGTSLDLSGEGLTAGRRYYYIVTGSRANRSGEDYAPAVTFSIVDSFVR